MTKLKYIKLLSLAVFIGAFASCNSDEDVSEIINIEKPTMTIEVAPNITVQEGESIPFTVTLSEPVGQSFHIFIIRDGNSTAGGTDSTVEDQSGVSFQQSVTIPPFVTTYSGTITINEDCIGEGDETLMLVLGDSRTSAVNVVPATTTITIQNKTSDALNLVFDWEHEFAIDGVDYTLCDIGYDIDITVYDENYVMINDFSAQTGACPEELTLSMEDYADGTYFITGYLYGTGEDFELDALYSVAPLDSNPFAIPVTVSYSRCGSLVSSFDEDGGSFVANEMFSAQSAEGTEIYLLTVVVENGQFTVINDTQTIDSGRVANRAAKPANRTAKARF